jgi:dihydroxyacetone kinase-like protein
MLEKAVAIKWLSLFNDKVQAESEALDALDSAVGDGDHGANMSRGMLAVVEALANKDLKDAAAVFQLSAMELLAKVGGASGPLYWSAFNGIAEGLGVGKGLTEALADGLAEMQKRGGAAVGDKTMVDVWASVVDTLRAGEHLSAADVDQFVTNTKDTVARKGRASYLGERSRGHIDPGAYSSGLFFKSMVEVAVQADA